MKKIMLMAFTAGLFAFTSTSCSSDDDGGGKSCQELAQDYADAFEAYFDDESEENCQALDDAADAYANSDCEGNDSVVGCNG